MAALQVIEPGLLTSVQDRGRWGWQSHGLSVSGPMDPCALRLGNALVRNPPTAAALEVTLVGPSLLFDDVRTVAVCGAEFALTIGGRPVTVPTPWRVNAGETLCFGTRRRGARAYVAVGGGCAVREVFGSRATQLSARIGGHEGRALAVGDIIPLGIEAGAAAGEVCWSGQTVIRLPDGPTMLRVLPGPHHELFAAGALDALQAASFVVSGASNRMGYRLMGPPLAAPEYELLSSPTVLGAVQVPPDGRPILLMAERQSTGGYPILATVIGADIGLAGQLAPGDAVSFQVCSRYEALGALIAQERLLMTAEAGTPS